MDLAGTGITAADLNEARDELAQRLAAITLSPVESLSDEEAAATLARALIAQTASLEQFREMGSEPRAVLNRDTRDNLGSEIAASMSSVGATVVVDSTVLSLVVRKALSVLTNYIRDRRNSLMVGRVGPFVGDILLYQRRGEDMLNFVKERLRGAKSPVIAIGHSLGGIMLVDLLSRSDAPKIDYLITAGSQSPFFYAIDALEILRPGGATTLDVPWLNLYDRNDLLSFLAEGVFGSSGSSNVTDESIESNLPFTLAHSAYWDNPHVYELIRECWDQVQPS